MHDARNQTQQGFTLIELLIVMAVVAISLGLTASPFSSAIADVRSAAAMRHIGTVFKLARQEALLRGRTVTVCALNSEQHCVRSWTSESTITVFLDQNNNRQRDATEPSIRELRWPLSDGEISWRASLARPYINFETTGGTWQNGTLYYCPKNRDARFARALVLSQSGRAYLPGDSNSDGIREDRSGKNLRC